MVSRHSLTVNISKLIVKIKYFFGQKKDVPYIFFIGFNKSGTTSIHKLFSENGIPSIHWKGGRLAKKCLINIVNGKPVLSGYDRTYRVFSDMMFRTDKFWFEGNSLFRELNRDYPNSYFVYNKRDINDWLNSRVHHRGNVGGQSLLELQKKILDTQETDNVVCYWRKARLRFEEDIREYFKGKKNFIEIEITDANFVEKLSRLTGLALDASHWKKHNVNPDKDH